MRLTLILLAAVAAGPDPARMDAVRESQAGQGELYLLGSGRNYLSRNGLDRRSLGATMTWTQKVELKTNIPTIAAAFGLDVA